MAQPRVPPHAVENETRCKLKAPSTAPKFRSPGRRGRRLARRLRGSARGRRVYLGRCRGAAAHLPAPGRLGGADSRSSGRGRAGSGAVLVPATPAAPGRLPGSDRFGAGRGGRPPLPALREAARVRRSGRRRGARRRGRQEHTQACCAGLRRPRGEGQGRARRSPRPSPPSPGSGAPRACLCPRGTHRYTPVSRAALPPPQAEKQERMKQGLRTKWVDSNGPARPGLGVAAGARSLHPRRASGILGQDLGCGSAAENDFSSFSPSEKPTGFLSSSCCFSGKLAKFAALSGQLREGRALSRSSAILTPLYLRLLFIRYVLSCVLFAAMFFFPSIYNMD